MFATLEEAIAAYTKLNGEHDTLKASNATLERTKTGLLEDLAKLKNIKKFLDANPTFNAEEYNNIKQERDNLEQKYNDLVANSDEAVKKALTVNNEGQEKRLKALEDKVKAAEARVEEEKAKAETERQQRAQADLERDVLKEFSLVKYNLASPKQLLHLSSGKWGRNDAGQLVYKEAEYLPEKSVENYLAELKEDPEYRNQFKGTTTTTVDRHDNGSSGGAEVNPYDRKTINLTECGRLEKTDPVKAARLKAAAGWK